MPKHKKNTFRLSVKTADGLSVQSSGECSAAEAFALYMLPIDSDKAPGDEFWAARVVRLMACGPENELRIFRVDGGEYEEWEPFCEVRMRPISYPDGTPCTWPGAVPAAQQAPADEGWLTKNLRDPEFKRLYEQELAAREREAAEDEAAQQAPALDAAALTPQIRGRGVRGPYPYAAPAAPPASASLPVVDPLREAAQRVVLCFGWHAGEVVQMRGNAEAVAAVRALHAALASAGQAEDDAAWVRLDRDGDRWRLDCDALGVVIAHRSGKKFSATLALPVHERQRDTLRAEVDRLNEVCRRQTRELLDLRQVREQAATLHYERDLARSELADVAKERTDALRSALSTAPQREAVPVLTKEERREVEEIREGIEHEVIRSGKEALQVIRRSERTRLLRIIDRLSTAPLPVVQGGEGPRPSLRTVAQMIEVAWGHALPPRLREALTAAIDESEGLAPAAAPLTRDETWSPLAAAIARGIVASWEEHDALWDARYEVLGVGAVMQRLTAEDLRAIAADCQRRLPAPPPGEALTLEHYTRTAVQVALTSYDDRLDTCAGPAAEDRAIERVQALLTPAGRLALAAELLAGVPRGAGAVIDLSANEDALALLLSLGAPMVTTPHVMDQPPRAVFIDSATLQIGVVTVRAQGRARPIPIGEEVQP